MNITLDPKTLETLVNERMTKAVETALGSYDVQQALATQFSESFATGILREALDTALRSIDTKRLTTALAEQIERTTTAATVAILADGLVSSIAKLRNLSEYSSEGKAEIARLRASLSDLGSRKG